jgi:hypothetical protein
VPKGGGRSRCGRIRNETRLRPAGLQVCAGVDAVRENKDILGLFVRHEIIIGYEIVIRTEVCIRKACLDTGTLDTRLGARTYGFFHKHRLVGV